MKQIYFLLLLLPVFLQAQRNLTGGGSDIKGEGGSLSQSIGQLSYSAAGKDDTRITEGVIQVFEIRVISGMENTEIALIYSAYPNPVSEMLTLLVENYHNEQLHYKLYDLGGRLIMEGPVVDKKTYIPASDLIPASYYLHVLKAEKSEKSFKIVKI